MTMVGTPKTHIARILGCSRQTVTKLFERYHQTGMTCDRPRSGRPRITTPGQDTRSSHITPAQSVPDNDGIGGNSTGFPDQPTHREEKTTSCRYQALPTPPRDGPDGSTSPCQTTVGLTCTTLTTFFWSSVYVYSNLFSFFLIITHFKTYNF